MANWQITIHLGDLIARWKDGEVTIPELAELVTTRIKESRWRELTPFPETFDGYLAELETATDRDDYVAKFEEIYDLADQDLVWIETF